MLKINFLISVLLFSILFCSPSYGSLEKAMELQKEGEELYRQGAYEDAIDKFEASYNIFQEKGYLQGLSILCGNMGVAFYYLDNYENSIKYFNQALDFNKEPEIREYEALLLYWLGKVYSAKKEYSEAEDYLNQSLAISSEVSDEALEEANIKFIREIDLLSDGSSLFYEDNNEDANELSEKYDLIENSLSLKCTSLDIEKKDLYYLIKIKDGEENLPLIWVANMAEIEESNFPIGDIFLGDFNSIYERSFGGLSQITFFQGKSEEKNTFETFIKLDEIFNTEGFRIPADREGIYIIRIYNGLQWNASKEEKEFMRKIPEGEKLTQLALVNNILRISLSVLDNIFDYDLLYKLFPEEKSAVKNLILDIVKEILPLIERKVIEKDIDFKTFLKELTSVLVKVAKEKLYSLFPEKARDENIKSLLEKFSEYLKSKKDSLITALTSNFKDYLSILRLNKFFSIIIEGKNIFSPPAYLETSIIKIAKRTLEIQLLAPAEGYVTDKKEVEIRGILKCSCPSLIYEKKIEITINGKDEQIISLDERGYFKSKVNIDYGRNKVIISFSDPEAGKISKMFYVIRNSEDSQL